MSTTKTDDNVVHVDPEAEDYHLRRVDAIFQPKDDSVRPEVQPFIGQRFVFTHQGTMESDSEYFGGIYNGQSLWTVEDHPEMWRWVPEEDLDDARMVEQWS